MSKTTEGVIREGELYTITQIKVRLGWTDAAMRAMRRRGLPIIRCGKRAYASGRQVIEFMERLLDGNESQGSRPGPQAPGVAVD